MKQTLNFLSMILIYLIIIGCGPKTNGVKYGEIKLGTHPIKVKPYSDQTSHSSYIENDEEVFEYTCGNINVKIKDHKIIVNGKRHGIFNPGDNAVIGDGNVQVNGEYRLQDIEHPNYPL